MGCVCVCVIIVWVGVRESVCVCERERVCGEWVFEYVGECMHMHKGVCKRESGRAFFSIKTETQPCSILSSKALA